jgi:aryl-alcohol dehydrogenase-like predicted oxidoreductase
MDEVIINCHTFSITGAKMSSIELGRRRFIQTLSSVLIGIGSSRFFKAGLSFATSEKAPNPEYRTLGKTGLKVTTVSMGVMNCSDPAVLRRAFDLGINFYDTADCYMRGRNEEMVGKVFQGKRDKVFIQTKVHQDEERKMRASVEKSLKRLRTDYIDVLIWHNLHSAEEVSDPKWFEFMEKMKKEGKTRFTGFSAHNHMASLLREAAKSNFHDVALVSYNFTHSKDLKEAVAVAANSGIGIVAMKTQEGGYKKEKMGGLKPHQAALKYVLMNQNISCAVPGVTTIEQIEECAAVMGASLSKGDLRELNYYQSFLRGRVCTMCGGCLGECPYGIVPQDLLRAVMYHDGYENRSLFRESLQAMKEQDIERCAGCPSCSIICKRGLNLRSQIQLAKQLFSEIV